MSRWKYIYNTVVETRVFSGDDEVAGNTGVMRGLQVAENECVGNFVEKIGH